MKKLLAAPVALVLLVGLAHGMGSKPSGDTGDKKLDSTLEEIGFAAKDDLDGFISRLSSRYDIPEQEIRQARVGYDFAAPDLFMATALARAAQRPVLSVADEYKRDPGRGWGVMAKDLGIKPGSREFHELKGGAQGFLDDMRATAGSTQKREREAKQEQGKMKKQPRGKGHGRP